MTTRPLRVPAVPLRWRMPLMIGLVALTAVAVVGNAVVATPAIGPPIDFTTFGPPGGDILTGRWSGVFGDSIIQAGPLELIFWGVPFLLGIASREGWIAFGIVVATLLSIAFALLVERLLRPITPAWSAVLAVGAAALAALSGQTAQSISTGHPAEFVIPLVWLIAAVLARRGMPFWAAVVLASTAGWELWGLLGVPVLLLAPRVGIATVWRSALGGLVTLAVLFLPFALLGPFDMFSFSWPIRENSLAHLLFPDEVTFPWPLRLTQGVLSVGAGAAAAVLARRSIDAVWLVPLLVCAIRLFTDPVLAPYYGIPPLMMAIVGAAFAIAQRSPAVFVACLVLVNLLVDLPLSVVTVGILVIVVVATVVIVVRRARREPSTRTALSGASQ